MIFSAIASIILAVASATNPKVVSPGNMTYNAGDVMQINWSEHTSTGYVNIDLVDIYSDVLPYPMTIASGISAESGKYSWTIPSGLKSAAGYYLRIWGTTPPQPGAEGTSAFFTVMNTVPNAVNTFIVLSPSTDKPCAMGTNCQITWNYPENSNYPGYVDIALYKVGNPSPLLEIATVSSSLKSYTWAVPNDPSLLADGNVYISVSGQGVPPAGPTMGNSMGANGAAFAVQPTPPPEEKKEEKEEKKKTPPPPKPKPEPKIEGAAAKDANAAAETAKVAVAVAAAAIFVPLALVL